MNQMLKGALHDQKQKKKKKKDPCLMRGYQAIPDAGGGNLLRMLQVKAIPNVTISLIF
jgi:hypothetical protein